MSKMAKVYYNTEGNDPPSIATEVGESFLLGLGTSYHTD